MNAALVRGYVVCYHRVRSLLRQPLDPDVVADFEDFLSDVQGICRDITESCPPSQWARDQVGPVMAAGLGAATNYRNEVPNPTAALRVFGLSGNHALSGHAAWKMVLPYRWESIVPTQAIDDMRRMSGLRLRLPHDPSPVDLLEELTRPRGGSFSLQLGHWLVDYFRDHAGANTHYAETYQEKLGDLIEANAKGDLSNSICANAIHGRPSRADWEALVIGRLPQSWLELRAGYATARHFMEDYWAKWQERPAKEVA